MPLPKLQIFLSIYYVYLLEAAFFLLILAFLLNFKYIKEILVEIGFKPVFFAVLISIAGIVLTSALNPRVHRIYYDEDIYNSIGQNIAQQKRAVMCNEGYYENGELKIIADEYNKQPAGFPYLISVIFRIFGENENYTFILNNIVFGLTAMSVFLITCLLFKDTFAGLTASLVFILIPANLQWFDTCASEPTTAFFACLAILAGLIYIKNRKPVTLFLFTIALAFSFNFRPESFLIFFVVGLLFLLKDAGILLRKEFYISAVILLILSSGIIIHTYAMKDQSWGATGPKFSMDYFLPNLKVDSLFYFDNNGFPLFYSILVITGLFFYKSRIEGLLIRRFAPEHAETAKKNKKIKSANSSAGLYITGKIILLSWFVAFWGIFLFFYAGTYKHDEGLSIRFSVLSYAPVAIAAGLGAAFLKNLAGGKTQTAGLIIMTVIIANVWFFLPYIRTQSKAESAACRMDHQYAMEFLKKLPENSIIFTHNPNMFLIHKQSAIQTSCEKNNPGKIEQLRSRFSGGEFLHFNYWSSVSYSEIQRSFTEYIMNNYDCQLLEEHYYNNYRFGLYKINGPKQKQ